MKIEKSEANEWVANLIFKGHLGLMYGSGVVDPTTLEVNIEKLEDLLLTLRKKGILKETTMPKSEQQINGFSGGLSDANALEEVPPDDIPFEIYRDDYIKVLAVDQKTFGGAHHRYEVYPIDAVIAETEPFDQFQKGPIKEHGVNGYTNEAWLAIIEHRLNCFQLGGFGNHFNSAALVGVEFAKGAMYSRTQDRKARNVEGYDKQ